ncbi:MAG: acetyltransferase [Thermoleophilia bacterium]
MSESPPVAAEKPLLIVGAGGHGREVYGLLLHSGRGHLVAGFVDDASALQGGEVDSKPVLGTDAWLTERASEYRVVVAVGDNSTRKKIATMLSAAGVAFATVIARDAVVSPFATVGEGAMIFNGVVINTGAVVGAHAILNLHATMSHDTRVGDFAHLASGARLAGGATVGEGCELGAGVVVNPGIGVGAWTVVGAGAAVVSNIPGNVVAVGVPAKVTRQHDPDQG